MEKIKIKQKKIEKDPNAIWNEFVKFSCNALESNSQLSETQKNAVLCFWYHSEVCSGGHSGYFDCHADVNSQELFEAMRIIGAARCAENFTTALETGSADDYQETDGVFYELESEFLNLLQTYLNNNISEFFEIK